MVRFVIHTKKRTTLIFRVGTSRTQRQYGTMYPKVCCGLYRDSLSRLRLHSELSSVSRIEFGSIDPNGRLFMCDSMHETAATPSAPLATAVVAMCVWVFQKLCIWTGKGIPCFGRLRFPDLTLEPRQFFYTKTKRLCVHTYNRQTVSFFFLACSN